MRVVNWGGMAAVFNSYSERTDFSPLLKGFKNDMCQCPHWGYVIKGAFHMSFPDGSEEIYEAGDLWFAPAPHTGWAEKGTEVIEFSPEAEFTHLIEHIKNKTAT